MKPIQKQRPGIREGSSASLNFQKEFFLDRKCGQFRIFMPAGTERQGSIKERDVIEFRMVIQGDFPASRLSEKTGYFPGNLLFPLWVWIVVKLKKYDEDVICFLFGHGLPAIS